MKRLFRTSKPIIDPLPPPTPPNEYAPQQQNGAAPVKKSQSALKLEGLGHGHASGESVGGGKNWFGVSSAPSVTPFPVDAGHGGGGHMRRLSRREKKDKGAAPSMLEIQQMQRPATQQKHESLPYPPANHPSRFYEESQPNLTSPDSGWTALPPNAPHAQQRYVHTPSPDLLDSRSNTPPLPIPSAPGLQGSGGSGRSSSVSSGQLYLPPGARPPTPPAALRPATPNFARSPMANSQSSLHSEDLGASGVRSGRDRGYSSASSMRGSDVESSTGHGLAVPGPKPPKIIPTQPIRSPLANSYAGPPPSIPSFPTPQPHPFQNPPGGPRPSAYSPMEDESRQLSMPVPPQQQVVYDDQPHAGKDKEKKKFWGMDMGWTGKKDKDDKKTREKDSGHLGVKEGEGGGRRSFDWSRAQEHQVGQAGYTVTSAPNGHVQGNMGSAMVMEDEQRGRMAGRMFFRDQDNKDPSSAKDVSAAIQMLCANPDPSLSAVYGVCDRMNHSDQAESICKDAARAIRKQFKHGNEGERRAVAVVWLLMMRNVPAVRVHAASKKVMAALEPILLAPPQKPVVNPNTHRTITDILADLAYNFGGEKGCDPLLDLWKKVKMPQEPDNGRPLSDDHQIFTPEAQFPTHVLDRHGNMNQQSDSSPYMNGHGMYPPHISEESRPGPGYANLPSHSDDMIRLIDESTAGKEAARVLNEAVTFCRPEELDQRPIIRVSWPLVPADLQEFFNKCFHAHESLTNQMDWAQAEARSSHERTMMNGLTLEPPTHSELPRPSDTIEEQALAALFEAHAALSEALRQYDEVDRLAMEQREMSEVRERSKKDTRMGRDDPSRYDQQPITGFLSAGQTARASSSRSPSPAGRIGASPRQQHLPLPPQLSASSHDRSRSPSPDQFIPPPRLSSSPNRRPPSPLGARAPRPLPNPFRSTESNASLKSSSVGHPGWVAPANLDPGRGTSQDTADVDAEDMPSVPLKPSRKALGKRPAVAVDPDNHFDPNDMFAGQKEPSSKASSEESVTADDVFFHKPVHYVYDAYQEKIERERSAASSGGGSGGSSAMRNSLPPRQGGGSGGTYDQQYAVGVDARA